jgi:hypothetical protein
MKKLFLVALACATLSGCGGLDRSWAHLTGAPVKVCVDGVEYLQFTSGSTVAYTQDGKVKTCSR